MQHTMTRLHSVRNTRHKHTDVITYGHKPHTFITNVVSTDNILESWQSTVYERPEDGPNKGPKHVGESVKCF
jgi:hypothetical protein